MTGIATDLLSLLKATRVHRTLTGLGTLMIPVAFANRITLEVIVLCLALIILYAAVGIQNAKKDKDYDLPSYTNTVTFGLILLSFIISSYNMIIFSTTSIIFLLGLFYNFFSRYILLMDITTVTATHHLIPMVGASFLLDLDTIITLKLGLFIYATYWLFINIKNLKDRDDDQKRGYRTIATEFKEYKMITLALFELSFFFMFISYFLFGFGLSYLFFLLALYAIKYMITKNVLSNNMEKALNQLRFMSIFYVFAIVVQKAVSIQIILFCSIPLITYFAMIAKETLQDVEINITYPSISIRPIAGNKGQARKMIV
jgi:4-hydroxybenzoate polyprenyltransferase